MFFYSGVLDVSLQNSSMEILSFKEKIVKQIKSIRSFEYLELQTIRFGRDILSFHMFKSFLLLWIGILAPLKERHLLLILFWIILYVRNTRKRKLVRIEWHLFSRIVLFYSKCHSIPWVRVFLLIGCYGWMGSCRRSRLRDPEYFPKVQVTGNRPHLSDLGLDLLERLLAYDPNRRISAAEALNHEYLKESPVSQALNMMPTFPSMNESENRHRKRTEAEEVYDEVLRNSSSLKRNKHG